MSEQRICDIDATPIDATIDEFFTVVDSVTGKSKDICIYCARGYGVAAWTANTGLPLAARRKPTAGLGTYVYDVITAGTTGSTEPSWPTTLNATVTDGDVVYITHYAPRSNAGIYRQMPSKPNLALSVWGWVNDVDELTAAS